MKATYVLIVSVLMALMLISSDAGRANKKCSKKCTKLIENKVDPLEKRLQAQTEELNELKSDKQELQSAVEFLNETVTQLKENVPCYSSPCLNGGTCYNEPGRDYSCQCKSGFVGETCAEENISCDSSPCLNGGTCSNEPGGGYSCQCKSGFGGETCEENISCDSSPCLNGGTCSNEPGGGYSCQCKSGFGGKTCAKVYKSCSELYKAGEQFSGVYTIKPDNSVAFDVYCDQTTAGGGWTVIQKRLDGSVDFYRGWDDYKRGFGNLNGEFWLGLDKIHQLTNERSKLRVDLEDFSGNTAYAEYSSFGVGDEERKYELSLGPYSGTAGDSLSYHQGMAFSTKDRDNDRYGGNCATQFKGAWWYKSCHHSNLNGQYLEGKHSSFADGVNWYHWKGYYYSVKRAEMKIKPVDV